MSFLPTFSRDYLTNQKIRTRHRTKETGDEKRRRGKKSSQHGRMRRRGSSSASATSSNDENDLYSMWNKVMVQKGEGGKANSPCGRKGHSIDIYQNRSIVVFGGITTMGDSGRGQLFNDTYIYNMESKRWTKIEAGGDCPSPRHQHCSAIVEGHLYVLGGRTKKGDPIKDAFKLDLDSGEWARVIGTGVSMHLNSRLLWTCVQMEAPYGALGDLILFSESKKAKSSGILEYYKLNLLTGDYSCPPPRGRAPSPRTAYSAVSWKERVVIFGGYDGKQRFNDLFVLNLVSGTWKKVKTRSPPTARYGHTATLIGDLMLVVGGYNVGWSNDVHILNLQSMAWYSLMETPGALLKPREGHAAGQIDGSGLYVFGGCCWPICHGDFMNLDVSDLISKCQFTSGELKVNESVSSSSTDTTQSDAKTPKHSTTSGAKEGKSSSLGADFIFTGSDANAPTKGADKNGTHSRIPKKGLEMVHFAPPGENPSSPGVQNSPRTRAISMSLSPSYCAAKKSLMPARDRRKLKSWRSMEDEDLARNKRAGRQAHMELLRRNSLVDSRGTASPIVSEKASRFETSQDARPLNLVFPSIVNKSSPKKGGFFLTEAESVAVSPPQNAAVLGYGTVASKQSGQYAQEQARRIDGTAVSNEEVKRVEIEKNIATAASLDEAYTKLIGSHQQFKHSIDEKGREALVDRKQYELEEKQELKLLDIATSREQQAREVASKMLSQLKLSEKNYNEAKQRADFQRSAKERYREMGNEAAGIISRLQSDMERLNSIGDGIELEDEQVSKDIGLLRISIDEQEKKKTDLKAKLDSIREEKKDFERMISAQEEEIRLLQEEGETLHQNKMLMQRKNSTLLDSNGITVPAETPLPAHSFSKFKAVA